ncbi:MAG TPA: aldolase [Jatrophihabitans sp.]|jgi:citrate lyase beta subunit|nr:aldolase [Jatrophihabitans sp.]
MLDPAFAGQLDAVLAADDAQRTSRYPGSRAGRQPVHTVYVPADRFGEQTVDDWRVDALAAVDEHGPLPDVDADLQARVRAKLEDEPIEDLRIDFEDGYGVRDDDAEDEAARAAGGALARMAHPAFVGIRMKSLEGPTRRRSVRTLELFLESLLGAGPLPPGFRFTLPKVTSVRQVEAMVEICAALESAYSLPTLGFEIQIETPQAIVGADGAALVAPMLHVAAGRCAGLHYGTYDYSASLGIAAAFQSMEHPAADHAKAVMQVAAAGTGVPVCDGSTNVLPVGTRESVRDAWTLHARLVRRSLERGFYQGWDLHPAQLPTRYAATFGFYRDSAAASAARLRAYLARAESGVLDEPATARALAGFLLRGIQCGALEGEDIQTASGVDTAALSALIG